MSISVFCFGPLETNCYIIQNGTDALVVDPGGTWVDGLDSVISHLRHNKLTLHAVILTHLHFDHIYGVAELTTNSYHVKAFCSAEELPFLSGWMTRARHWGLPSVSPFTPEVIEEGPCQFGSIRGEILFTPGHSAGGLSLYLPDEKAVISGDTLFHRIIGRTDLIDGNLQAIKNSIRNKLFTLPDETVVYPGHGPSTTIIEEKRYNPFV